MTDRYQALDRDEVLFAFHEACPRPTVDEVIDWTGRYPQFADDIRAHAAVARDWEAREEFLAEDPSQTLLARAYSRALNALYSAGTETAGPAANAGAGAAAQSFQEILAARGMDVPRLAREIGGAIGIARSVLADMVNGAVRSPVGPRFLDAITRVLSIQAREFYGALDLALSSPRLGHAKATTAPTVIVRTYEEVIRTSGMSPEQVRYWLEESG